MLLVGVVEILAGLLVAVLPRIGAYVVAAWLAGIIVNLLTPGGFYDIALRDFGLLVGLRWLGWPRDNGLPSDRRAGCSAGSARRPRLRRARPEVPPLGRV